MYQDVTYKVGLEDSLNKQPKVAFSWKARKQNWLCLFGWIRQGTLFSSQSVTLANHICELMYGEEGRQLSPLSVLHFPVLQHEQQFEKKTQLVDFTCLTGSMRYL